MVAKKKTLVFVALMLAVLCSLAIVGCSSSNNSTTETSKSSTSSKIELTDQAGRTVTLDKPAERIASGYYISSSTCIALGLKDKLVAVEEKIDKRPIYKLAAPELIGKVADVGSAKNFNVEACIAANPDLVILPKKAKDYASTLEEAGIKSIVVNPESHEQLKEMITLIGKATGSETKADALLAKYKEIEDKVSSLTSNLSDSQKPTVYMCSPSSYMSTAPKSMYQASLIKTAGGKNAGDGIDGDNWTDVSIEQIVGMNPEVIVIPTNNMANGQPDYTADQVKSDTNLASVSAISNNKVYNMPAGLEAWDSPVPSGVLGMLWMVNTLHPDLYSQDELVAEAKSFYKEFYGFDMDASIITGK